MDIPAKNGELSKIFLCCKPVTTDDASFKSAASDDICRKRKSKVSRSFSRAIKTVFFETSLMKKIQGKKSRENSFRSNSNTLSPENEKSVRKSVSYKDFSNPKEIFRINSDHSSSLFSSNPTSRSTSISSNSYAYSINSRSLSEIKSSSRFDYKFSANVDKQKGFAESYAATCIFLVSLFSLVIWGKVFAILICTLSCLFFGPPPHQREQSPENDVYMEEQKRRAVVLTEKN